MINKWTKIPAELKNYNNWLTWYYKHNPDRQKPEKVPNIGPGLWDSKKYYNFPAVLQEFSRCQQANNSRADGIGIAFTNSNDLIGIDIDGINDANIPPAIQAILLAGKTTYIEKSVSGKGFHLIGKFINKGLLLKMMQSYNGRTGAKSKDLRIELYITGRYFTVSGDCINNCFGDIGSAFALAWEYITGKSALTSVASLIENMERSGLNQSVSVASIGNSSVANVPADKKRSGPIKNSVAGFPERPANAFTDDEINNLPLLSIAKTIDIMYKNNPKLKEVLETEGAISKYYKTSDKAGKDNSPSGIDMEIISSVIFWLFRYNTENVVDFLEKSKLNRKGRDYLTRTVEKAKETAIEYFPAVKNANADQQVKIRSWIAWKKDCAKIIIEK